MHCNGLHLHTLYFTPTAPALLLSSSVGPAVWKPSMRSPLTQGNSQREVLEAKRDVCVPSSGEKTEAKRSKMVCYSLLPKSLAGFALGVPGHLLCEQSLIKGQLTARSDHQYLTATTLMADRQLQACTLGTAHLIKKEPSKEDFDSMLKTKYSVLEPAHANVHAQTDIYIHL